MISRSCKGEEEKMCVQLTGVLTRVKNQSESRKKLVPRPTPKRKERSLRGGDSFYGFKRIHDVGEDGEEIPVSLHNSL
jgi:hypothetical protein